MNEETTAPVTADDTGKPVVDEDGNSIGSIADVPEDPITIDPDPDLTDDLKTLLGWEVSDEVLSVRKTALERDPYSDLAVVRLTPERVDQEHDADDWQNPGVTRSRP